MVLPITPGWSITGNTGINAATHFMGTTTNVDVIFRRNNIRAGRLGANNTAFGVSALTGATGSWNTAMGTGALENSTGSRNTALGFAALAANTSGNENTAVGTDALSANISGHNNTAVGRRAMGNVGANTTGSENTALGYMAFSTGDGLSNATAIGARAMVGASNSLVLGSINGVNGATNNTHVGIGTTTPLTNLHVDGGVLATGTLGAGTIPQEGPGVRMMWYPGKAAFRVGDAIAAHWDDINIGVRSVAWGAGRGTGQSTTAWGSGHASGGASTAWGVHSLASGFRSTVWGEDTEASGELSTAWGRESRASGDRSTAWGFNTRATSANATAWGGSTHATGSTSTAWGIGANAPSYVETSLGSYPTIYTPASTNNYIATDRLITIGNGAADATRSNALTILKNGNTAIGNVNPTMRLHVFNGPSGGGTATNTVVRVENNTAAYLQFSTPAAQPSGLYFGTSAGAIRGGLVFNNGGTEDLQFRTGGNTNRMTINNIGWVGINVGPAFELHLSTALAAKPGGGSWLAPSDARLKKDIAPFTDGLDLIQRIDPVWYTYNGEANMPEERFAGTLAQELQKVAPYMVRPWVHTSDDGSTTEYLAVDYSAMNFMMVNAFKEQQAMIDRQQSTIERLEQEMQELRRTVNELKR